MTLNFIVVRRWGWVNIPAHVLYMFLVSTSSLAPREIVPRVVSYWFARCGAKGTKGNGAQKLSAVKYQK